MVDKNTAAAYRAINFALDVFVLIRSTDVEQLQISDYFADETEPITATKLLQDTQTYLGDRPNLDRLIGEYMFEICPDHTRSQDVETAAALI